MDYIQNFQRNAIECDPKHGRIISIGSSRGVCWLFSHHQRYAVMKRLRLEKSVRRHVGGTNVTSTRLEGVSRQVRMVL